MAEERKHGPLFRTLKIYYQDWKIIDAEELKVYIPYSITQEDYDEIVGINSSAPVANNQANAEQGTSTTPGTPSTPNQANANTAKAV